MAGKVVTTEEVIEDVLAQLNSLITEVDEMDVISQKIDGDAGEVCNALLEGEADIDMLKTEMKELFQVTIDFITGVVSIFNQRDEEAKREIEVG